jgi:hypothetical protein
MRIGAFAIGLALACAAIGGARATEVQFTISGGDGIATFELPLSATPDASAPDVFFFFSSVPVEVGGSQIVHTSLTFWHGGSGVFPVGIGGFVADNFIFSGPQFYSGSESSPTFIPGIYRRLTNGVTGKTDSVTIAELPPISDPPDPPDPPALGVPEPSTWAMLLLGFVGLSYAGFKKAKTRTTLAA